MTLIERIEEWQKEHMPIYTSRAPTESERLLVEALEELKRNKVALGFYTNRGKEKRGDS